MTTIAAGAKGHKFKLLIARIAFQIVPALLILHFLFRQQVHQATDSLIPSSIFSINRYGNWEIVSFITLFIALGAAISASLYSFRLRFLPGLLLVVVLGMFGFQLISSLAVAEFDTFFLTAQFLLFSGCFLVGWLFGWGFVRVRLFSLIYSLVVSAIAIVLLSGQYQTLSPVVFGVNIAVVFIYVVYALFTEEIFKQYQHFIRVLVRRLIVANLIVTACCALIFYLLFNSFSAKLTQTKRSTGERKRKSKSGQEKSEECL
jgi:hypothetical protein